MLKTLICMLFHRHQWRESVCDQYDDGTECPRLRGDYCDKCDAVRNIYDAPLVAAE